MFEPQRRRLVDKDGQPSVLTRGEFELLRAFSSHPGQILSRTRLLKMVTHRQFVTDTRTIDVLVGRVRKKIERNPSKPELIITVHGEGYVFIEDSEA